MATGLEALGIACNVMQVISFAGETIKLCKIIYDGKPTPTDQLLENANQMIRHVSEVEDYLKNVPAKSPSGSVPATSDYKGLINIAQKCKAAAEELKKVASAASSTPTAAKGSITKTAKATYTSWRSKSTLEKLSKSLSDHQSSMEAHILLDESMRNYARELQRTSQHQALSKDLQHFISQYAMGHTKMSELIVLEHRQTRDLVKKDISRATDSVKIHFDQGFTNFGDKKAMQQQRERLLGSLKFPELNARRNMILESYKATFNRVFGDVESVDSSSSDDEDSGSDISSLDPIDQFDDIDQTWDDFITWLRSGEDIYWISGKPGSGKSTLMKFLLNHQKTQDTLNEWRPGATILSHFFWKIGTQMECSVKGLLCSLLHQALCQKEELVEELLKHSQHIKGHDNSNDWSLQDLRNALLAMLKLQSPMCIFIDGLDEISDTEGTEDLMEIVELLRKQENIKVCVSSRPEKRFADCLSTYPRLSLHELSKPEMRAHVIKSLLPLKARSSDPEDLRIDIIDKLVGKADGVFLWLGLALKSVNEGIINEDSEQEIFSRLKCLPKTVEKLYEDMWARLNGGKEIYRQKAAQYFHAAILFETNKSRITNNYPLTLFPLMAIDHEELYEKDLVTVCDINEILDTTRKQILTRCAGLLEVHYWDSDSSKSSHILGVHSRVGFMHRTAHDFLLETEAGKQILMWDPRPLDVRCIEAARGILLGVKILHAISPQGVLGVFNWHPLEQDHILLFLEVLGSEPHEEVEHILHCCWDMYERGELPLSFGKGRPHFLALLISRAPTFTWFVRQNVKEGDSALATIVLQDIYAMKYSELPDYTSGVALLLSRGANPEIEAAPMWTPKPGQFTRFTSAVSNHLSHTGDITSPGIDCKWLLDLLQASLSDLDARTSWAFDTEHSESHQVDHILNWRFHEVSLVFDAPNLTLIMEVNVAFLAAQTLKRALLEARFRAQIQFEREWGREPPPGAIDDVALASPFQDIRSILDTRARPFCRARFIMSSRSERNPGQLLFKPADFIFYRPLTDEASKNLQDSVIFPDLLTPRYGVGDHIREALQNTAQWEEVDFTDLFVLAEEKLGVCYTKDLAVQPQTTESCKKKPRIPLRRQPLRSER